MQSGPARRHRSGDTCVVDTGRPNPSASAVVAAAVFSAQAPWATLSLAFPMRSPTVITMPDHGADAVMAVNERIGDTDAAPLGLNGL